MISAPVLYRVKDTKWPSKCEEIRVVKVETDRSRGDSFIECEESLWSCHKQLLWKRDNQLIQSFTCENVILQALWTTFLPSQTCIVIREEKRLIFYSESGQEHAVNFQSKPILPFPSGHPIPSISINSPKQGLSS
jgi:hypothetical protein